MDFDTLVGYLQTQDEFQDLSDWTLTAVVPGRTSHHTYRLQNQGKDYFVKETTPLEQNTLRLLSAHQLRIAPKVVYPSLLTDGILVTPYVSGGRMRGKKLAASLIEDYALLQNALNSPEVLSQPNSFNYCKYNDRDDGTFRRAITENEEKWEQHLVKIREYDFPISQAYERLVACLRANKQRIADVYSQMPFGWLHNDFREENIVGTPPVLMDWGSSYGHGPFLYDLAPFLLMDETGFETFLKHSNNCKSVNQYQIRKWLYAAGWARFVDFLRWHIQEGSFWQNREECESYLTDEYQAWKALEESGEFLQ